MSTGVRRGSRRFLTAIAVGGLAACLCAVAAGPAVAATASKISSRGTTAAADAARSARAVAAARTAMEHLKVGMHATDHRLPSTRLQANDHLLPSRVPSISNSTVASNNWSGYADDNTQRNSYTQVSGSWTVPAVICGSNTSAASFWVGLDGYNSGTVEQAGTSALCDDGTASYYTWWEMYPTDTEQIVGDTVSPGDSIYAQVVDEGGGNYALQVTDYSNPADSLYTVQSCAATCADASAEWIAEAPFSQFGFLPLADYQSWSVTGATVTSGSPPAGTAAGYAAQGTITSFPDDSFSMYNPDTGDGLSVPGPVSGGGFTTYWSDST
jgi:hypothetical protein